MAERISLEVPATLSALSTVRMVVGGLGARLDFSLEELDDLYLALDHLLEAALDAEELPSIRVLVLLDGSTLRVSAGDFTSHGLRDQISITPGDCIDLCIMLRRLVDDVAVQDEGDGFCVILTKRKTGSPE